VSLCSIHTFNRHTRSPRAHTAQLMRPTRFTKAQHTAIQVADANFMCNPRLAVHFSKYIMLTGGACEST